MLKRKYKSVSQITFAELSRMKNENKFYKGFVGIKSSTTHIRLSKNSKSICLVSTFCVQIQVH